MKLSRTTDSSSKQPPDISFMLHNGSRITPVHLKLHFLTNHHLLHVHAGHYEDLAYVDDRTLYKVSRLAVSSTLRENSCRSGQEELVHPNSQHHIHNKHYHFYPKLLLISRDCLHQLLRIYLHVLGFHNLYA